MGMSEVEWINIFANNLILMLDEKGLTQKDLAVMTGFSESIVSEWINKKKMPSVRAILAISYELGEDLYDLIDFGDRIE